MILKTTFSRIVLFTILCVFLVGTVLAQRERMRKSTSGTVYSTREIERNLSNDEYVIHDLINQERQKKGMTELFWDENLARMARNYSRQMARESFFSHYDPDGKTVVERAKQARIRNWNRIGENLFFCEGYNDFNSVAVRGWMKSPDHRRNILDRQFTSTGIGIATTRGGQIYITQVFTRS